MFDANQFTAAEASLLAAIVGAVSALVVVLVKDVIIEGRKEKRERRRILIEKKLSEIYSPLWIAFGGDDGQLGNIIGDKDVRDQISARFHLLGPELQDMLSRSLLLGRFERGEHSLTVSEMERLLQMTPAFKQALQKDLGELQKEFATI